MTLMDTSNGFGNLIGQIAQPLIGAFVKQLLPQGSANPLASAGNGLYGPSQDQAEFSPTVAPYRQQAAYPQAYEGIQPQAAADDPGIGEFAQNFFQGGQPQASNDDPGIAALANNFFGNAG